MLGPKEFPFAVVGERCLIKADGPRTRSIGGIEMPVTSQLRPFTGTLLDAGLQARDKLHDHGINVGDRVFFGKFAGVVEEWDHVVEGDHTLADDAYDWGFLKTETGVWTSYKCANTGAIRRVEAIVVLNSDDIIASEQLAARMRRGEVAYVPTPYQGRTVHLIGTPHLTREVA